MASYLKYKKKWPENQGAYLKKFLTVVLYYCDEVIIMASRLERYHKQTAGTQRRSERNQSLYDNLYEEAEYTNIENVSRIEKTNEIDLQKIREMLNRQAESTEEEQQETNQAEETTPEPEKSSEYDVKKFLDAAKQNRNANDARKRSLDSSYYQTTNQASKTDEKARTAKKDSEELQNLIHTITSTRVLEDLNNKELSENLLGDFQGDEENSTEEQGTEVVYETTNGNEKKQPTTKDSFYTSSLKFKNEDFEDFEDLNQAVQTGSKMVTILLVFLFLVMAGLIAYIVMMVI